MMDGPEITIARGVRHTCFVCTLVHDVNVAIDRATWVCPRCARELGRVGEVLLRRDVERQEAERG